MPVHPGGQQSLELKFSVDPGELGYFLVQVTRFVRDKASCICYLGLRMEGRAPQWYVSLYFDQGSEV